MCVCVCVCVCERLLAFASVSVYDRERDRERPRARTHTHTHRYACGNYQTHRGPCTQKSVSFYKDNLGLEVSIRYLYIRSCIKVWSA